MLFIAEPTKFIGLLKTASASKNTIQLVYFSSSDFDSYYKLT